MRIKSLEVEGLRSITHAELNQLKPLSIIVGMNNSGKSNIVAGLRFFQQAATGIGTPPRDSDISAFTTQGGFQVVLDIALTEDEVRATLEKCLAIRGDIEKGPVEALRDVVPTLTDIRFVVGYMRTAKSDLLEVHFFCILKEGHPLLMQRVRKAFPDDSREQKNFAALWEKELFWFVGTRMLFLEADRNPSEEFGGGDSGSFDPNAYNLGSAIARESGYDTDSFARLQEWVHEVFPEVSRPLAPPKGQGGFLASKEKRVRFPIPRRAMSSGVVHGMAILARLAFAPSESVVVVEEPEIHQHPQALNKLVERFLQQSTEKQLLVITHSQDIIFHQGIPPDNFWFVRREDGGPSLVSQVHREKDINWIEGKLTGNAGEEPGQVPPPDHPPSE